jgi:hypothetical protein
MLFLNVIVSFVGLYSAEKGQAMEHIKIHLKGLSVYHYLVPH